MAYFLKMTITTGIRPPKGRLGPAKVQMGNPFWLPLKGRRKRMMDTDYSLGIWFAVLEWMNWTRHSTIFGTLAKQFEARNTLWR
jgi:hypothetical protein